MSGRIFVDLHYGLQGSRGVKNLTQTLVICPDEKDVVDIYLYIYAYVIIHEDAIYV